MKTAQQNSKISIAMAVFNGEKFIEEQLQSILDQTLQPDEVIMQDDCSSDHTVEVVRKFILKNKLEGSWKIFINEENLFYNKNFEAALRHCTGNYIALSDQDDIWVKTKLEKCYHKLREIEQNGLPSLVMCERSKIDSQGKPLEVPIKKEDTDLYTVTLLGRKIQGCCYMMNRQLLDCALPLPDNRIVFFDWHLGLLAAMIGNKYNMGEPLVLYRRHSSNVTKSAKSRLISYLQSFLNQYFLFFEEGRKKGMEIIQSRYSHLFIKERAPFFNKIYGITNNNNPFLKIKGIFSINEFTMKQKMMASIAVSIHFLKKKLLRH